jgi:hypothetical protein
MEIGLLRNAVLDSFLIHARALVDFFYRKSKYGSVVASDYLSGEEKTHWEKCYSKDPDWFNGVRRRINRGVAHISYDRHRDAWDYGLIERGISAAFNEFVKRVSIDLLGARWERIRSNIGTGSETYIELPPFLIKGGILKTSFYPLPNSDWYPDEQEDD